MQGLKFRILLDSDAKTEVFRDIVLSASDNFETFYQTIIQAFGLKGDQMASFYVSNDSWDKGHEINLMDMSYDDDDLDQPANVMSKAVLKDFIQAPDQKFILIYDFLAMQLFLIELIEALPEAPQQPAIVLSIGDTPASLHQDLPSEEVFMAGGGALVEAEDFDEDDLGFNDYDDGYPDEELDGYHETEF